MKPTNLYNGNLYTGKYVFILKQSTNMVIDSTTSELLQSNYWHQDAPQQYSIPIVKQPQ